MKIRLRGPFLTVILHGLGLRPLLGILAIVLILGCFGDLKNNDRSGSASSGNDNKLRVVYLTPSLDFVSETDSIFEKERRIIVSFAEKYDYTIEWIRPADHRQQFDLLVEGKADICANLSPITKKSGGNLLFSIPVINVRELLVVNADKLKRPINSIADIKNLTIWVERSSPSFETLKKIQTTTPDFTIKFAPDYFDSLKIARNVAIGDYEATVIDSHLYSLLEKYEPTLSAPLRLSGQGHLAYSINGRNIAIKEQLDRFLNEQALQSIKPITHTRNFSTIRHLGTLRMLTLNNSAIYYLDKGKEAGYDYDMIKDFADNLDLKLDVIVAPSQKDLIPWLIEGKGDLVAAGMTITDTRKREVAFTLPIDTVDEVLVTKSEDKVESAGQLNDRTVCLRKSSSSYETITAFAKNQDISVPIRVMPATMSTPEIIDLVLKGECFATCTDSNLAEREKLYHTNLDIGFVIARNRHLAIAVRKSNRYLLEALNSWIADKTNSLLFNTLKRKYFSNQSNIFQGIKAHLALKNGRISPYDNLIKRYAADHGLDWRLLIGQIYVESGFNPLAISPSGAQGLFQLLPETAASLGVNDLTDPEENIRAGIRYLEILRNMLPENIAVEDKMWFSLAAYNVGIGHVDDARSIAKSKGLDPTKWFDNVEQAMLLLDDPNIYRHTTHGYCRSHEPVEYVKKISNIYRSYSEIVRVD